MPAPTGHIAAATGQSAGALRQRWRRRNLPGEFGSNASSAVKCGRPRPWWAAIRCSTKSCKSGGRRWNRATISAFSTPARSRSRSASEPNSCRYPAQPAPLPPLAGRRTSRHGLDVPVGRIPVAQRAPLELSPLLAVVVARARQRRNDIAPGPLAGSGRETAFARRCRSTSPT